MLTNLNWTWDQDSETWYFGTRTHGCGVFEEGTSWSGNVVAYNNIELLDGFESKEKAQVVCEERLHELEEAFLDDSIP